MLKVFLFIILLFTAGSASVISTEVTEYLRVTFYSAVESEDKTTEMENFILSRYSENYNKYPPLILAYYAGVQALKAKHAFNPYNKVKYLVSSLNRLSEAVEKENENMEIRFIRFSILHNLPGFMGYNKERNDDLNFLYFALMKKDYSALSNKIQKGIAEFVLESKRLPADRYEALSRFYSQTFK